MPDGVGQSWSLEAACHWPEVGGLEIIFRNGPPCGGAIGLPELASESTIANIARNILKVICCLTGCPVFYLSVLESGAAKAAMEAAAGK